MAVLRAAAVGARLLDLGPSLEATLSAAIGSGALSLPHPEAPLDGQPLTARGTLDGALKGASLVRAGPVTLTCALPTAAPAAGTPVVLSGTLRVLVLPGDRWQLRRPHDVAADILAVPVPGTFLVRDPGQEAVLLVEDCRVALR